MKIMILTSMFLVIWPKISKFRAKLAELCYFLARAYPKQKIGKSLVLFSFTIVFKVCPSHFASPDIVFYEFFNSFGRWVFCTQESS